MMMVRILSSLIFVSGKISSPLRSVALPYPSSQSVIQSYLLTIARIPRKMPYTRDLEIRLSEFRLPDVDSLVG